MTDIAQFAASIGVNIHVDATTTAYGDITLVQAALAYTGISFVRDHAYNIDLVAYTALATAGIGLDLILDDDPQAEIDSLISLAPAIRTFEGPNEVDYQPIVTNGIADPILAAVAEQQSIQSAVRGTAGVSTVPLIAASVADPGSLSLYAGNLAYADVANLHAYSVQGQPPRALLASDLALAQSLSSQPVAVTETGYFTIADDPNGVDELTQAKLTLDTLFDSASLGISLTFLYELFDEIDPTAPADPNDPPSEHHYGLFNADGSPKLVATALHNLNAILAAANTTPGTAPPLSLSTGNLPDTGHTLILTGEAGTTVVAIWAEPEISYDDQHTAIAAPITTTTINFGTLAASVKVLDPLTGTDVIASYIDVSSITVGLTDHPLLIAISGPAPTPVTTQPVDPAPADTTPVNPAPVDTTPVIPAPVDTPPVNTAPVDTPPVNPAPVDTTPVNPAPVDPTPIIPAPVDPTPIIPAPVDTTPVNTAPVDTPPVNPAPVNTTPVNPAPVDPTPIIPAPVDTTPIIPAPVDTTPVVPAPVDPTPVNPAPVDTTPVVPAPVDPTPVNPAPVDTTPVVPAPVDPTPVNPAPVDTTPVNPAPVDTTPVNPAPVVTTPIVTTPMISSPVILSPVVQTPTPSTTTASAAATDIPLDKTSGVYRFFDKSNGTYFYTASAAEAKTVQQTRPDLFPEGTGGIGLVSIASPSSDPYAAPVYRFFDLTFGTHFFTASTSERDALIATRADLSYEPSSVFYEHTIAQPGDTPVYRFFDTVHGTHFYTDSATERASIISTRTDLVGEGIGFYEPPGNPA